jgi:hypothetical protein
VLSFILATILFAIIYREVPDTKIHWGDVKMAAVMIGNGIHLYQRVVFMVCSNIHHHVSSWSRRSTYDSANMDLRNEPVYAVSRRILKNLCFTIRLTKITQT